MCCSGSSSVRSTGCQLRQTRRHSIRERWGCGVQGVVEWWRAAVPAGQRARLVHPAGLPLCAPQRRPAAHRHGGGVPRGDAHVAVCRDGRARRRGCADDRRAQLPVAPVKQCVPRPRGQPPPCVQPDLQRVRQGMSSSHSISRQSRVCAGWRMALIVGPFAGRLDTGALWRGCADTAR